MNPKKAKFICHFFGNTSKVLEVMAYGAQDAVIVAAAQRIENAQHYDFDYIECPDGKLYRPYFGLNDAHHPQSKS